jgi:hypothetical protein
MTLKTMLIIPSNGKNICHDNPELMHRFSHTLSLTKNWKGRGFLWMIKENGSLSH